MNAVLSLSIAVFLGALTVWGLGLAAAGRRPDRTYLLACLVVEAELIVQALIAVIAMIAGHEPDSYGEFAGYLVVSVGLVPFALNRAQSPQSTRFDSAVVGVVCFAVAIAVLRLLSLW